MPQSVASISFTPVYDPNSGRLFFQRRRAVPKYPNQVIVIDPVTQGILNAWTIGNGPNQLAVSDDGQFLYVGLDGDKKVAQVSLPAGIVNFTAGLGNDVISQNPMLADAIRVLPARPHSWAATRCVVTYTPCGNGIAVFDDAVQRPTFVRRTSYSPMPLSSSGKMPPTFTAPRSVRAPLHSTSSQSTPRESHFRKVLRTLLDRLRAEARWIPTALPSMSAMGKSSIPLPLQSTPMAFCHSRSPRHLSRCPRFTRLFLWSCQRTVFPEL